MRKIVLRIGQKAENTLYIIGNGFDLAHGMKTSYENFHQWLLANGYNSAVCRLENLYPGIKDIKGKWCDIETALGSITLKKAIEYDINFRDCLNDEYSPHNVYRCGENIKNVVDILPFLLRKWIASIDTNVVMPQFDLDKESKYLSFNYTRTLEEVYKIYNNNILHIHETVIGNRPLVVGYGDSIFEKENYNPDNNEVNITKIKNLLSHCCKPVKVILQEPIPKKWFENMGNISNVIVYGHSCSQVDKPYFEKVADCIKDDARWTFYVYDCSKNSSIENYAKSIIKRKQQFKILNKTK